MKNKFCSFPFHSVFVTNDSNSIGIKPCCRYEQSNVEVTTPLDYFNSEEMISLREHFLSDNDSLPSRCFRCDQHEKMNVPSYRQANQAYFEKYTNTTDPKLKFVALDIGWACNMSCYMCYPNVSSGVAEEYKQLGLINDIPKKNIKNIKDILDNIPENTIVDFINGEFFLDANGDRILDMALEKNWELTFTTNCSIINASQFEKINRLDKKNIIVSCDGVEQLYDIMRYPSDWTNFNQNFKQLAGSKSIRCLRFVVQHLNLFGLIDVFKFANAHHIDCEVILVQDKPWLSLDALDDADRLQLIKILADQLTKNKQQLTVQQSNIIKQYIELLSKTKCNQYYNNKCIDMLSKIWRLRQQDFSLYQSIYPTFYNKICDKLVDNI
jgi:uncharacterized protein (DUF779 family)